MPPRPQHHVGQRAIVSSTAMPAAAAVTAPSARVAHLRMARQAGWADDVGRVPSLWPMRPATVSGLQASVDMSQGPNADPNADYLFPLFFIRLNITRNSYNSPKFIGHKIKLKKI
jgi:hypothetical protein